MFGFNGLPGLEICDDCLCYVEDCECQKHEAPHVSMVVPSKRLKATLQGLGPDKTDVTPAVVIRLDRSADGLDITDFARKAG